MTLSDLAMFGSYGYRLVALSVVIAVGASYAALDLVGRVTATRGRTRRVWLAGGATTIGLGIWSMHYIGMLALRLPVPVRYDWPTVPLSLLAAILASAVALYIVTSGQWAPGAPWPEVSSWAPALLQCTTSEWTPCA